LVVLVVVHQYKQLDQLDVQFEIFDQFLLLMVLVFLFNRKKTEFNDKKRIFGYTFSDKFV
jgi:hypothetical protein